MYDNQCKNCGAYLDPGERCDCQSESKDKPREETKERGDANAENNT